PCTNYLPIHSGSLLVCFGFIRSFFLRLSLCSLARCLFLLSQRFCFLSCSKLLTLKLFQTFGLRFHSCHFARINRSFRCVASRSRSTQAKQAFSVCIIQRH